MDNIMDLLIVTLVQTNPQREIDVVARLRLIADTIRNAQGLLTANFYRGRGGNANFVILTTWDSEESWQLAQERYSPKNLLLSSATQLLTASPEQWLMSYLWGYSRPASTATQAMIHLAYIRPDQFERVQKGWLEGMRRLTAYPLLAFSILARGIHEHSMLAQQASLTAHAEPVAPDYLQGPVFLNLLTWANDMDREDFLEDTTYQAILRFIRTAGSIQTFTLEPF